LTTKFTLGIIMAASEILGLFTTPEQYQQSQRQAQEAQAIQYANLNPRAQADYGFFRAGQQLGGAIGGALGGQDPQLKIISMRQQLASQLDPNNPDSFMQVAKMAADTGDQQFAIVVADAGRKAMSEFALIQQRNRERQGADPFQQLLRSGKFTSASLAKYQKSQNVEDLREIETETKTPAKIQEAERVALGKGFARGTKEFDDAVNSYLERPERPEPRPSVGSDREAISLDDFDKNYYDLTPAQRSEVNKKVDAKRLAEAKESKPVFSMTSNQPVEPKDWLKFSEFINKDPLMSRTSSILSDAPTAIQTIKNSTQNNFSSASLPAAIAKLTGEGKNMSNQDIERYTRTGGLDQRIAGDVVGFFTGKKTDVTKAQAEQFAVALYRGALLERKQFIQDQAESTGYAESPNYKKTIEQLDKKLAQFKLITPSAKKEAPSTPAAKPEDEALINKYLPPKKP
jgi:hypothetical protein